MQIKERVNLTKYFLFTSGSFALCLFYIKSWYELLGLACCYIGVIVNHLFHVYGGQQLIGIKNRGASKSAFVFLFSKLFILAFFLIISIQILEKKIFIPVTVYLFMLFTLSVSLKRDN